MKKTLAGICKLPGCRELSIIAGEKGLNREIFWVSTVDSPDIVPFTNKGDLNFVTGVGPHGSKDWMEITKAAYERELAGLVFCPDSPYVDKMPSDVIDFGNEHDFPIFTIPWESKISDFSRLIGRYIEKEDDSMRTLTDVLRDILLGKETLPLDDEVKEYLGRQKIDYKGDYRTAMFLIEAEDVKKNIDYRMMYDQIHNALLKKFGLEGIAVPLPAGIAVIFKSEIDDESRFSNTLISQLAEIKEEFSEYGFGLGIGNTQNGIDGVCQSYHQAMLVLNIYDAVMQEEKKIYRYDDLGYYKALYMCSDPKALILYSDELLGPIIRYDESNDSDLMNCLETFFDCECNVKQTAETLFVHRNTVLYKIKKIDELLQAKVFAQKNLFELQLALVIRKMYSL
ncbi:MAG: PucR family transcriptional regulator ligand-binding domain-containing protein [Eubacteriaceae bacterium]|nr:PucR family transcriptional regulator ligand-binding domain-containing protein [Eubacteriaceae bacterium]